MTDVRMTSSRDLLSKSTLPMDQDPAIVSLRPDRLVDYIGQSEVVETLKIAIDAAAQRAPGQHQRVGIR